MEELVWSVKFSLGKAIYQCAWANQAPSTMNPSVAYPSQTTVNY